MRGLSPLFFLPAFRSLSPILLFLSTSFFRRGGGKIRLREDTFVVHFLGTLGVLSSTILWLNRLTLIFHRRPSPSFMEPLRAGKWCWFADDAI